jgi:hypothetical protein
MRDLSSKPRQRKRELVGCVNRLTISSMSYEQNGISTRTRNAKPGRRKAYRSEGWIDLQNHRRPNPLVPGRSCGDRFPMTVKPPLASPPPATFGKLGRKATVLRCLFANSMNGRSVWPTGNDRH